MEHTEWGILIVNYLFLGGISAGCFFASALAAFLYPGGGSPYERIARYGAWIAPWPVSIGSALLIFDLGNWGRFYKLFLTFRWQSPMSIGSWLLMLFSLLTLLYAWSWLPTDARRRLLAAVRVPLRFDRDLSAFRLHFAGAGLPLAVGVGIYTGVLLGAVQSRPFWNTNLVAQMFLFSALSTGCAVLIAVLSLSRQGLDSRQARFLYSLDVCLAVLELFIVLPYLVHGELSALAVRESLELVLGGPYTFAFWVLFMGIGLLLPLAIEIRELAPALLRGAPLHSNRWIAAGAASLIVFGGYTLRYIFVYAGQASRFR